MKLSRCSCQTLPNENKARGFTLGSRASAAAWCPASWTPQSSVDFQVLTPGLPTPWVGPPQFATALSHHEHPTAASHTLTLGLQPAGLQPRPPRWLLSAPEQSQSCPPLLHAPPGYI
ncbi:Hypothetical predicted protein [Marmota monax]|uniref:Uncharacterized protein n=1 Tax=Marmota monax TaxID=9995 RepID=A0A5E4BYS1_MARMO|nr:Hypothetical predicted protein [Marmota monax]